MAPPAAAHVLRPLVAGPARAVAHRGAGVSAIHAELLLQMRALKLPRPVVEYENAIPGRKFRLDIAYPDRKLVIEVDGAVHRIKTRFHADIEKHALLVLSGWKLLRVGGHEVRSGLAVEWVREFLAQNP